jgi:2-polyprenyl-6-hydroxyphenyl methylase/3-demethylubiquinone-9 3-methyltransferase
MNNPSGHNVFADEVEKFSRTPEDWWGENGAFATLHQMNRVRLEFITQETSLKGMKVLDIGCGGGILSEPLTRLGAEVIGIDASAEAIEVAKNHAKQSGLQIDYRCGLLENLAESAFDLVFAMEIVEHLPDVPLFIEQAVAKIKSGGKCFLSTINRTPEAFFVVILGAEYILQKLPKGTHAFNQFVRPDELKQALHKAGMKEINVQGAILNPLTNHFFLSSNARVNYFIAATKT